MNTQYSKSIKETIEKYSNLDSLNGNSPCSGEIKLGYGNHTKYYVYLFILGNAFIYGVRKKNLNSPSFTLFALFASYPIAYITSYYLFGYDKIRRINSSFMDNKISLDLYEKNFSGSNKY
jgi:hypothetical protein